MTFRRHEYYSNQVLAGQVGYPGGKAKNKLASNDTTATPWERTHVNDLWGFLDALMGRARRTRSGNPDTSVSSDHALAIDGIIRFWLFQLFNPAGPLASTNLDDHAIFRSTIPVLGWDKSYWRWVSDDTKYARLWLYHHTVAAAGSPGDWIRQPIQFPIPRLKIVGIFATFDNAAGMKIRIDKRRRMDHPEDALHASVVVLDCDDFSGAAVEAYTAVDGSVEQNPDIGDTWEYVLTIIPGSSSGARLENVAIQFQWMPLSSEYDAVLDARAAQAANGTTSWG